jgi:DNA modification methylase
MEIKIHSLYDKLVDPMTLKNHDKNRNKHPQEQIERFAKILKYQGWRQAIKVSNRSGKITTGHGRKLVAIYMGLSVVPVVYQDYESEEQEYADIQADNAIALWAEMDMAGINADLADIGPMDIDLLGIQDFTIDMAEKDFDGDPDEVPEVVEPQAKLGQIYQLGDHRLMCGDSTDALMVNSLLGGEKADMVFTDPPYGMNLDTDYSKMPGTTTKYKPVKDDDVKFDCSKIFELVPAKQYYIWGADYFFDTIPNFFDGSIIVWTKRQSEEENKVIGSAFEICWSYPKQKKVVWFERAINQSSERLGEHPTQRPTALTDRALLKHQEHRNIVDLFGGSGSTLMSCEKNSRKCFMMEYDPHYVDVIIARWEKFTGKKAELING